MEEDLTADLSQYQLSNVDVPLSHDVPKTTLESLLQVKKEFEMKIGDATEKNDTTKKGRYQRQLKKFDAAIKATNKGAQFNYEELQNLVPPGFSKIPLSSGRPILAPSLAVSQNSQQQRRVSPQPPKKAVPVQPPADYEVDDDFLAQLEKELDGSECGDDDDEPMDAEEARFNQQIAAAQKFIPKMDLPKDGMMEEQVVKKQKTKLKQQANDLTPIESPDLDQFQEDQFQIPQIPKPKQPQTKQPQPPSASTTRTNTQHSKHIQILQERQRLFKEAALKAKQDGNTSVALVYLRHAKGFDSMLSAAESGLPLDMANLPVPPQMEKTMKGKTASPQSPSGLVSKLGGIKLQADDFEMVEHCDGDRKSVYKHLCDRLRQQFEIASGNFKHFTNMGDISNANKFKKIAQESIQDLEALKNADKLNEPVPLYHYEKRCYETIDCNSDLTDNDLEIEIIRAINLSMPKDYKVDNMNTFVKFEFPFPPEEAQTDKTKTQYASLNPEYNQSFKLQIQRKQTKFMRLMNRKELKLDIYIKGGFLRSDKLLASCGVKLQQLENASTLHNAYDLMEGRRSTGSKLELKIRIREPLLHKGVQTMEHKWLIIDKFQPPNSVKL